VDTATIVGLYTKNSHVNIQQVVKIYNLQPVPNYPIAPARQGRQPASIQLKALSNPTST